MTEKTSAPYLTEGPVAEAREILLASGRRWHDQEVFLAVQLKIIREQQAAASIACALCDLLEALPEAAQLVYGRDESGTVFFIDLLDAQRHSLADRAVDAGVQEVIETIRKASVQSLIMHGMRLEDGREALDIGRAVRFGADQIVRRKANPHRDPLTQNERNVLVEAASEGFDSYSSRLAGEWGESDEHLASIRAQQDRLAAILGR